MKTELPMHLRDLAMKVARHEMGHYVVARLLGFKTGDVAIEISGPIDGHRGEAVIFLNEPLGTKDDAKKYIRRRIEVLYAGALAEALPPSHSPSKEINIAEAIKILEKDGKGAEQDNAKARELLKMLRNLEFSDERTTDEETIKTQLKGLNNELWANTVSLVQENSDLINGLGMNLAQRVKKPRERAIITTSELDALPAIKKLKPAIGPTG